MNLRYLATLTTAGLFAATLAYAQPASAPSGQDQGTTSGPAAGSNVEPSTAAQKKKTSHHRSKKMAASSTAAGAPGVAAKAGSESGPAPSDQPQPH